MKFIATDLPEVIIIEPTVFGDDRGFFLESWNEARFSDAGLDLNFVQDNHSMSTKGVLRGLHFQNPNPQGKLVRVTSGRVFDVAVDIRKSSPHFKKWVGVELSAGNKRMLWVPPGFAHGFLTLEDGTEFLYKCTALYDPSCDRNIRWDDPDIGIKWPLGPEAPKVSAKDLAAPILQDADVFL
jgi:dTDP-4-dehydrorhamnose 3,5-epimerase